MTDDDTVTVNCMTTHLTSFAVLVSVSSLPNYDNFALNVVSYIGCGVSILFLLLTIAMLLIFRCRKML